MHEAGTRPVLIDMPAPQVLRWGEAKQAGKEIVHVLPSVRYIQPWRKKRMLFVFRPAGWRPTLPAGASVRTASGYACHWQVYDVQPGLLFRVRQPSGQPADLHNMRGEPGNNHRQYGRGPVRREAQGPVRKEKVAARTARLRAGPGIGCACLLSGTPIRRNRTCRGRWRRGAHISAPRGMQVRRECFGAFVKPALRTLDVWGPL